MINADVLSRIKINHFRECASINSKILANYETNDQDSDDNEQAPIEIVLITEFNTFVDLFKTTCLIDYSKVEFMNKQILDRTKNIPIFLWEKNYRIIIMKY